MLDLSPAERRQLWQSLVTAIEAYHDRVHELPVLPPVTRDGIAAELKGLDFQSPRPPGEILELVLNGLETQQLHTSHPAYYGVFNPCPSFMGIVGDTLASAFNSQLASWTSAPFAIEAEQHVLKFWARKIGWKDFGTGTFTTGGAEANHTAVLAALCTRFKDFSTKGLAGLAKRPSLYVSTETHHSFLKAARLCGLGTEALREIAVTDELKLDVKQLEAAIAKDRAQGFEPFMIVGTAGSTSAGTVDDLGAIAAVAETEKLWLHVDAAWGGPGVIVPEVRHLFSGIEASDSVTIDAHKWLSVPMTAGMFLTRHRDALDTTFRVDQSYYMPADSVARAHTQPYNESMQWSRRFLGLKLFMSLATAGEDGYREVLRHQIKMGNELREKLRRSAWQIKNDTPLPVVCFVDGKNKIGPLDDFAKAVAATGKTWITTTQVARGVPVLRAGISNYRTQTSDLDTLVATLDAVRDTIGS